MVISKDIEQSCCDNHFLEKWEVTMKKKKKPRVWFSVSEDTSPLLLLSLDSFMEE